MTFRTRRLVPFRGVGLWVGLPVVLAACDTASGGVPAQAALAQATVERVAVAQALPDTAFTSLIARLSEPGGYFDTDNLISNEDSYLHVLGAMRDIGVEGGAFIGVGPDQGFSYIAQVRPCIAFMIDVRRDNLVQHLWFKAMFSLAETRAEYLSLMFGKAAPQNPAAWTESSVTEIVAEIESASILADQGEEVRLRVREMVESFGVEFTEEESEVFDFIHRSFVRGGVRLKFTSFGRAPNPYYPSYRDLLLATDLTGREGSYLAREGDYQFVRSLQLANRVVPVVGDLAGDHALKAIGDEVRAMGQVVTAFYTSNVEFYLFENRAFARFARNVVTLPRNPNSVIIRSYFRRSHPLSQPGFLSTQLLQRLDNFVGQWEAGGIDTYYQLVTVGAEPPR